jgi:lysophospholipase L1-like esterase
MVSDIGMTISPDSRVLFIGDSITDCGRDRDNDSDLGRGYPLLVAGQFTATHPNAGVEFLNRGNGGNRVCDLLDRWDRDCLKLEPDVVSIMIGINDTWRAFDKNDPTSTVDYERDYREILRQTRETVGAAIVLIEPYLIPVRDDQHGWRADLDPRIGVVRRLAAEFGAALVAADGAFAQAAASSRPEVWCADGVHATAAGHTLLAREWLAAVDV